MFGGASSGGDGDGGGNDGPINDDLLEELRMMYPDAPDALLEKAARCATEDEAYDMVTKGLENPDSVVPNAMPNIVDAVARLQVFLPQLGQDEVRGVLAGFDDDIEKACAIATASPHLLEAMHKNGSSFLEAQKADEEAKLEEKKRLQAAGGEDESGAPEPWMSEPLKLDDTEARMLIFGKAAVGTLRRAGGPVQGSAAAVSSAQLTEILTASCSGCTQYRTTRGDKSVVEAMAECLHSGLHTLGGVSSPVNSQVVPAMRHIFSEMSGLPPADSKRRSALSRLVDAFQDCQAVQAREVLSLYADLTSQTETLETQLKFALLREKEAALHLYITQHHEGCDLDHTQVKPHQQRPHLFSAYVHAIGDAYGLDEPQIVAAGHDRFLADAQRQIGAINVENQVTILRQSMSVKEWLQSLAADINNQSSMAHRLIQRHCIFAWAKDNLEGDLAHQVFYDVDRSAQFVDIEPKEPTAENSTQPFLSYRVLVNILASMRIIKHSASWWMAQN